MNKKMKRITGTRLFPLFAMLMVSTLLVLTSEGEISANEGHPVYGNGSDGELHVESMTVFEMDRDMECTNVTIDENATLDTRGFTLRVSGILTNNGEITDTYSGGNGGPGGPGGEGARPYSGYPAYGGGSGGLGYPGLKPGAGNGGHGGDGGGGGGGVLWEDFFHYEEEAIGGEGGDGGDGGRGGGYVKIYAKEFENNTMIQVNGENGEGGLPGSSGEYNMFENKDIAGGGGGGGGGGSGGDGGTVEIIYKELLNEGRLEAFGGYAGMGASGGYGHTCSYGIFWPDDEDNYTLFPQASGGYNGGDGGRGEFYENQSSQSGTWGAYGFSGDFGDLELNQCITPSPDIKVNGMDDDFTVNRGTVLNVTLSHGVCDYMQDIFEAWIWVTWIDRGLTWSWVWPGSWVPGMQPALSWSIEEFGELSIAQQALPPGTWSFHWALDDNNTPGIYDNWYADSLTVTVTP